jgi:acyl-CoA synthetase (AMP-forming)/AMP-acid ligase II
MPLYHSTALLMGLSNALSAGATFAISRKFSTSHFCEDVRKHGANIIQYVGETCRYLLSAPPAVDPVTGEDVDQKHSVRLACGNGLRPDVWNRFKERFGIEIVAEFTARPKKALTHKISTETTLTWVLSGETGACTTSFLVGLWLLFASTMRLSCYTATRTRVSAARCSRTSRASSYSAFRPGTSSPGPRDTMATRRQPPRRS